VPWFAYVLLCEENSFYVGLTSNIKNRFLSHQRKENIATKEFSKLELVYSERFATRRLAEDRERQIKGWSIAKKKALISGNISLLKQLSKS